MVFHDGVPVAPTLDLTDRSDRSRSGPTATGHAYRGRGPARWIRWPARRRAAAAGCKTALTSNDAENARLLAIMRRLGYRPVAAEWGCRRASPG